MLTLEVSCLWNMLISYIFMIFSFVLHENFDFKDVLLLRKVQYLIQFMQTVLNCAFHCVSLKSDGFKAIHQKLLLFNL